MYHLSRGSRLELASMAPMKTWRADDDDDDDDVGGGRHRYPTRWKLGRHSSSSSSSSSHHNHQPQVAGVEDISKHQPHVHVPCKRRKVVRRHFCLPREILFDIFLLFPAKTLHDVVRYVCKQWFDIVHDPLFVTAHHHRQMSSPGFLIQELFQKKSNKLRYFEAAGDSSRSRRLKLTEISIPLHIQLIGSFDGLVLLRKSTDGCIHYLVNLVTKVKISLPPLPLPWTQGAPSDSTSAFGLTSSGLYKVFCYYGRPNIGQPIKIMVFTIGVDTDWRFVDPPTPPTPFLIYVVPCFIGGFIYMYSPYFADGDGIAMDLDTETFHYFSTPSGICLHQGTPSHFLTTATGLGFIKLKEGQDHIWRFWKLTDVKTGKWTEMAEIDVSSVLRTVDKRSKNYSLMNGFLMLIDDELWFYRTINSERRAIRYNLVTQRYQFFPYKTADHQIPIHPHVHTLVSPKNCDLGIIL